MNKIIYLTLYNAFVKIIPKSFFRLKKIKKIPIIKSIYKKNTFFFIQIGANDGILHDPINYYINKYKWKGIFIEPVDQYFSKLKRTYAKNKGLFFENSAISNKNEKKKIYKVKENTKHVAYWYQGIASFDKNNLLRHKYAFPEIEKFIEEQLINCITFQYLINKYKVKNIDLLCIDVEGHEMVIIKQLLTLNVKPKVIYYEHKHMSKIQRQECKNILSSLGYIFEKSFSHTNTLCFLEYKKNNI